jgi:hypothetical protein
MLDINKDPDAWVAPGPRNVERPDNSALGPIWKPTLSRYQVAAMRPYGCWRCTDGREVLFNRRYRPILERRPGQSVRAIAAHQWVLWVQQIWFYNEQTPEPVRRQRTNAVLMQWGLPQLPKRVPAQALDGNPWVEVLAC